MEGDQITGRLERQTVSRYDDSQIFMAVFTGPGQASLALLFGYVVRSHPQTGKPIAIKPFDHDRLRRFMEKVQASESATICLNGIAMRVRGYGNGMRNVDGELAANRAMRRIVQTYRLADQDMRRVLNWDPMEFVSALEKQFVRWALLESSLVGAQRRAS